MRNKESVSGGKVVTFGCRLNSYESEVIRGRLASSGLEDVVVFNSCAVTKEAERQVQQAIRKHHRENPQTQIIVTGCAAQINPGKYNALPEVSKVIGNQEKLEQSTYKAIASDAETEPVLVNDIMSIEETASHLITGMEGRARAFLQVQNGCNHRCTFCIIPYGRGNSRSVPVGAVVEQSRILVENGYNELVLTGVDITDYGLDLPGRPRLGQMVRRVLANVPELQRIRLSSIDVAEIDDDLLDLIENEPRFMPHLHLSLQSGDNMVLKRMKRRHSREQVIEFCEAARKLRPDIVFGADIIAGFPTETEDMFHNTLRIIEEANLVYLHVFPYSERDGTPAADIPQAKQVPVAERKARAAILREAGKKNLQNFLKSRIGKVENAVIEKPNLARTEHFAMVEFDSELDKNANISHNPPYKTGDIIQIKITGYQQDRLLGEVACIDGR